MVDIPLPVARTAGYIFEIAIHPFFTRDNVLQMQEDCIEHKVKGERFFTMKDLNIVPSSMDRMAFAYLHRFRPGGHFVKVQGYYGVGKEPSTGKQHVHYKD
jgi:hypothetical protein